MSSESRITDFFLVTLCLAGMVASLYLFWKDLNISFNKLNEEPIGVVYFKHNTVQRRLDSHNVWERIQQSSPVYNGDRVRTGGASEAFTVFTDGSRLDLHENTLVQLFKDEGQNSVEFLKGSVSVSSTAAVNQKEGNRKSGGIKVKANSQILTFSENTSAVISSKQKNEKSENLIVVTSGKVSVADDIEKPKQTALKQLMSIAKKEEELPVEDGHEEKILEAGEIAVIAKETQEPESSIFPEIQEIKRTLEIQVYLPGTTSTNIKKENEKLLVPFYWKTNYPVKIDFSEDRQFESLLASKVLPAESSRALMDLDFVEQRETVFWRISAIPLKDAEGILEVDEKNLPFGTIFIQHEVKNNSAENFVELFGQEKATEISALIQKNEKEIVPVKETIFSEAPVLKTEPVESSKKKNVVPVIVEGIAAEAAVAAPKVAGKIEVPAKTKELPKVAAKAKPVPKKKPAKPKETIPELVKITPKLKVPPEATIFTEELFGLEEPKMNFAWEKVKGADSYTFVLMNDKNEEIFSKTISDLTFVLKEKELECLDNGNFLWSVQAQVTKNGKIYKSKKALGKFSINLSGVEEIEIDEKMLLKH